MTDYVYPQRTVEPLEDRMPLDRWYSPLELRPWVLRALQYRPRKRKISGHSDTATSEKWYSPLELRPWVVRAMGYQPKIGENSGHPHISPFRRYVEEIVAAKIAEHLGTETATNSSRVTEDSASEVSATENTTEHGGTAANIVHGLEEALANLGHAEEGAAHQHHPAPTGIARAALNAAEQIIGAQNHPALQFPIPKIPRSKSSRREYRKRLISLVIDLLLPYSTKSDSTRRSASASASASESGSAAKEREGHAVRSVAATRPYRRSIWPWLFRRKNRDRGHKGGRRKGHRNDDHLAEGREGDEEDVVSDETSGSESESESELGSTTSVSARVGAGERESDDDDDHHRDRPAQDRNQPAPRPEIHGNVLRVSNSGGGARGGCGNGNGRTRPEPSMGRDKTRVRSRGRSRSRSRGQSWTRDGPNWNFQGLPPPPRHETRDEDW